MTDRSPPRPTPGAYRALRSAFVTTLVAGAAGCSSSSAYQNPPFVATDCSSGSIGGPCKGSFTCDYRDCVPGGGAMKQGCVDGVLRALGPATCSGTQDAGSDADAGSVDVGADGG